MLEHGALTGVKVVDLSRMLPGPYCSMILADHGADVIALEDVRFRKENLYFEELSRNKRHISVNLKTDAGKEFFFRLIRDSDVLVEGFRPGVADSLGIDFASLHDLNPRLIYCSITGYGQTGPLRKYAGHDINYISRAGVLDLCGEKGRGPAIPGVQMGDIAGGSLNGVIGILLALLAREKTGEGQFVDISMTDGLLGLLILPEILRQRKGSPLRAGDWMLAHRYGCYNVYRTKDNRYFSIGALEKKFWRNLCLLIDRQPYIDRQYSDDRQQEIIDDLQRIFEQETLQYWQEQLEDQEVCFAPVQSMEDIASDPLFAAREMICRYEDPSDPTRSGFGIPVKLGTTGGTIRRPPARFGGNTREVMEQYGYSSSEVDELCRQGVVWCDGH